MCQLWLKLKDAIIYRENTNLIQWQTINPRLFVRVEVYQVLKAKLTIWYGMTIGTFKLIHFCGGKNGAYLQLLAEIIKESFIFL